MAAKVICHYGASKNTTCNVGNTNGVLKDMAGLTNSQLGWCIKDRSCHLQ